MKRLARPVSGSRSARSASLSSLEVVDSPGGHQVGHQLEDRNVGVVEVLGLAGDDPQGPDRFAAPDHRRHRDGTDAGPPTGLGVDPGVRLGVAAQERHADLHAEPRQALVADGTGSLGIGLQAADGPMDHHVLVGHLNGRTVCIGHCLHPFENHLERTVARRGGDCVHQSLGLDDVVQQVKLRASRNCRHGGEIGAPEAVKKGRPRGRSGGPSRCAAQERHADLHAEPRQALVADGAGSLGIGLQAADGPMDHHVLVGHFNGRTVCIGHCLHPFENHLECTVARRGGDCVHQSLGLDDVVQQVKLRASRNCCHGGKFDSRAVVLKHNSLWQRPGPGETPMSSGPLIGLEYHPQVVLVPISLRRAVGMRTSAKCLDDTRAVAQLG